MDKIYIILIACFLFCFGASAQNQNTDFLPYASQESYNGVGKGLKNNPTQDPKNQQEVFSGEIKIMPNPATDFFKIDTKEKIAEVHIVNLLGRVVKQYNSNQGDYFDISGLPSGVYFVKIDHAESSKSRTLRIKVQ
jgi:hypothetical protein